MEELKTAEAEVAARIDSDFARDLEVAAVRIPSTSFEEREVAMLFAESMEGVGLEVELFEVPHPYREGVATAQAVGILRGRDPGPTLMLNGHMDHMPVVAEWDFDPFSGEIRDGWILGRGSQDDKGGIVAAITAAKAIIDAGVSFAGTIWVCPVAVHKLGCLGTKLLIDKGWVPDYCINTENTAGRMATSAVGFVMCDIVVRGRPAHFGSGPSAKALHSNMIDQIARVAVSLGDSLSFVGHDSWLTFESHPALPGYPAISLDRIESSRQLPMAIEPDGGDFLARVEFQVRTVPGQTVESIKKDLNTHLGRLKAEYPPLEVVEVNVPTKHPDYRGWDVPAFEVPEGSELLEALASAYRAVLGSEPVIGAGTRLGAVGDGNVVAAAGAQVVQYGPGDMSEYDSEPVVNERIGLQEITDCAEVLAVAAVRLLGDCA